MGFNAVNEKSIEKVKTGRGHTTWLYRATDKKEPSIMIRHWGPETNIPVHSHPFNEMFYVLDGEIEIGGTTYTAGSCIYIPKGQAYGPTMAPKGGKVLRYAESSQGAREERQAAREDR